ncbi:MAG: PBSX family phage terminase large subunit [Nitrospiraceae bacterium]
MEVQLPEAFEFLFEPSRHKAAHGGRGGAKSHSFAAALVIKGKQRPLRWLFAREIQKSIKASVKQLLDDKIRDLGLNDHYYSTDRGITGRNGTEFLFAGLRSNPESVKSMEGLDGAWVEEANNVSNTSIKLLTPTVRKEGSELWWSWNRRSATDPVDKMFLGGEPPPRSIVRKVGWRDNPWFPEVLQEEMAWDKRRDHDKWLHVWEGEPVVRSEARVFKNWRVDDLDHLIEGGEHIPRFGADWGFSVDPTVLIKCYVIDRVLYFREEAYKVGCEIDETPSLFAGSDPIDPPRWKNTKGHPGLSGALGGLIVADNARPETISYMNNRGFTVKRAIKGAGSVEDGIEFMRSHDIVVHPSCKHIEDELILYSYKVDPLTDEVLPELADKNNHTIDAARYAVESARRKLRGRIGIIGGEAIPLGDG